MTPLIYASGRGFDTIVQELLTRGAKVNQGDKFSTTPLIWASRGGHTDIVDMLLDAGANVDVVGKYFTDLTLINYGLCVFFKGLYGWTALAVATKGGFYDVVISLLRKKPNLNTPGQDKRTALHVACRTGDDDIALALIAAGANLNLQVSGTYKSTQKKSRNSFSVERSRQINFSKSFLIETIPFELKIVFQ